jgi:hypothetical protein
MGKKPAVKLLSGIHDLAAIQTLIDSLYNK